jgi:phosphate starvation-inducible PhoH-like protein
MSRRKIKSFESANSSTIIPFEKQFIKKSVKIIPRNIHQEEYLEYLLDPNKSVVIATGPAGTGKTVLAMMVGVKMLLEKKVSKLILTRPMVSVLGEEHLGALPGTLEEKMDPWVRPLMDVLLEHYGMRDIETMIYNRVIEIVCLSHLRGRNFKDAFIIADELQNSTISQCKMLLTRLCENAKIVLTGDNRQSDRRDSDNGLLHFKTLLSNFPNSRYISSVDFGYKDIERSKVVSEVLKIYGED